jgi:SHS2 domain-containing protein
MFEHFEHTADLGLRVQAATLRELLAEAGRGFLAMVVANPQAVRGVQSRSIELSAGDPAYLLFDWLNELLYAFESQRLLLCEFDIDLSLPSNERGNTPATAAPLRLRAVCRGEPMDPARHTMDHEVKAITYHGLSAEQAADGTWQAEVIVDI